MGANAQTSVWTFTAGSVLTAAQMNDTARTGVPVFATTTTRDAAFGGTGEKTLAEGQVCYIEAAPQRYQIYNGTAWKDFHVNYTDISSTQAFSGFTKGNGTIVSKYTRFNDLCHFFGSATLGSTSSVTGAFDVTLPFTADQDQNSFPSSVTILDSGTARFMASSWLITSATARLTPLLANGTYVAPTDTSATVPMTWATNDQIHWNFTYKVA